MESDELIPIDIEYEREDLDLEDELDEVAELPPPKKAKTKSKNKTNNEDKKRRRTLELEELTEDIMTMNINKDEHLEDTSSMGPSISSNPGGLVWESRGLITQLHFEESSTFLVKGDATTMLSVQVQSLTHLKKHLPVLPYGMCMNQKTGE
ncbi:hypothetical protein CMV_000885 [Castanea mollissima]|uniref:Uncharacterized protein n=1 Tax=Castanea mollissima TaxID=60419 RepID=A0A8J4RLW5_9ROSI|nr:hypothetical protein CMV_000885 [Castanea mollissima]